jgi:hypothetical protein
MLDKRTRKQIEKLKWEKVGDTNITLDEVCMEMCDGEDGRCRTYPYASSIRICERFKKIEKVIIYCHNKYHFK